MLQFVDVDMVTLLHWGFVTYVLSFFFCSCWSMRGIKSDHIHCPASLRIHVHVFSSKRSWNSSALFTGTLAQKNMAMIAHLLAAVGAGCFLASYFLLQSSSASFLLNKRLSPFSSSFSSSFLRDFVKKAYIKYGWSYCNCSFHMTRFHSCVCVFTNRPIIPVQIQVKSLKHFPTLGSIEAVFLIMSCGTHEG